MIYIITTGILDVIYNFFIWLIGLLPVFSLPEDFFLGVTDVVKWCFWINNYLPLDVFLLLLPSVLGFQLVCAIASAVLQLL